MDPSLQGIAQSFLDLYVQGASAATTAGFPDSAAPGIRHRSPAKAGIPPEYAPDPNPFDNQQFAAGTGPETFTALVNKKPVSQAYLYLDQCPLERIVVSATGNELHLAFLFVVQWPANQFDPNMSSPVCLPSSKGEPEAIVSECVNRLCDYLGSDQDLVGSPGAPGFPNITSDIQLLTLAQFQALPPG